MSNFYDDICHTFIRPARQHYSDFDLGIRQNFTFLSKQNLQIKASFFKQQQEIHKTCIIYLHSFNGSRLQALRIVPDLLQHGFHICTFDFAGCGNSQGNYVSLGCNERWDAVKAIHQVEKRWGIKNYFVWGRSMGAVTAIKTYQIIKNSFYTNNIRLFGLILDSAFISLRKMVVQICQTRAKVPQFLIKAFFSMVASSIQQRAGFKVDQLQLDKQIPKIKCPVLLLASKQDTFIKSSHSQQIFSLLSQHQTKRIQYTTGQHYSPRQSPTLKIAFKFIESQQIIYDQNKIIKGRLSNRPQDLSKQKPSRSLRKFQPKNFKNDSNSRQKFSLKCINKFQSNNLIVSQANILPRQDYKQLQQRIIDKNQLFRRKQSIILNQMNKLKTNQIQRQIVLRDKQLQMLKNYKTQKIIDDHVLCSPIRTKQCLKSKNKPTFINVLSNTPNKMTNIYHQNLINSQKTQQNEGQNHLNIVADKLKKKSRQHRNKILEFKNEELQDNSNKYHIQTQANNQKIKSKKNIHNHFSTKIKIGIEISPNIKKNKQINYEQQSKSMTSLIQQKKQYRSITPTIIRYKNTIKCDY